MKEGFKMELTQRIVGNRPKQSLTHKRCQELRRRVIRCSQSYNVMGDMMLDFDIVQTDDESLMYIAQLLVKHGDYNAFLYYLKTTLQDDQKQAVKELVKADMQKYDAEREGNISATLDAYKVGLINNWKKVKRG